MYGFAFGISEDNNEFGYVAAMTAAELSHIFHGDFLVHQ
jgi:hypothetical protein